MASTSILIVSSDSETAENLNQRLTRLSYTVVGIAATNQDAVSKIEERKPNLIITDINLNRKGGGIKTGELVNSSYNLPVIYLAGNIGQAVLQRSKSTDPFGYIFDPSDDKQLLATIETALTRFQLERKLRESRQWLNTTLSSVGDGIIATDEHGFIRFINPVAMQLTGWKHTDAVGRSLFEVFFLMDEKSNQPVDIVALQQKLRGQCKLDFEGMLCNKSGNSIPIEANATVIMNENEEVLGMVVAFRDITRQRDALLEIQRQANRAEALVRAASQLNDRMELNSVLNTVCLITNQSLKTTGTAVFLQSSNKFSYEMMAAYSEIPALQIYSGNSYEIGKHIISSILSRENPVAVIPDLQARKDLPFLEFAQILNIRTAVMVGLFRRDEIIGVLISIVINEEREISADDLALVRGLADQASSAIENADLFEQVHAGRTRQQFLARQLVKVQEDERRSLSRELHDEIGQMLTGLQFSIKSAMAQVTDEQQGKLDQIQVVISVIISQIRELSINLRPSLLDDLGVLPTLKWHFERYEAKTGICVNFEHRDLDRRFSPDIEVTAFRIIQEALTNVARYAKTDHVDVFAGVDGDILELDIQDQGEGFDVTVLSKNESVGLEGMRERAYAIGGMLDITSRLGEGTRITATLPITGQLERREHERDYPTGR